MNEPDPNFNDGDKEEAENEENIAPQESPASYSGEDIDPFALSEDIDMPSASEAEIRIETLENDLDRAKEAMLRAIAEAENTRKRAAKDVQDARKFAISGFARDLLDFADNFKRALTSIPQELKETDERIASLLTGIEAMDKELLKTFEKNGVQRIDPLDQMFDPNFHEVMFEAPIPGKAPGVIIEVIESGYVIGERLLRPARVGIAKDIGDGGPDTANEPGSQIDTEI